MPFNVALVVEQEAAWEAKFIKVSRTTYQTRNEASERLATRKYGDRVAHVIMLDDEAACLLDDLCKDKRIEGMFLEFVGKVVEAARSI